MKYVTPFNVETVFELLWVLVFFVGVTINHNNIEPVVSGFDDLIALV